MTKKLFMVHHADGREQFACKKCGSPMAHLDTTHSNFSQGEYSETGGEFLQCTNPDCMMTSDYPKMRVRDFKHLPEVSF